MDQNVEGFRSYWLPDFFFSYYNKSVSNPNYGDIKMSCFIEFSPVFMNVHHIQHVGIQITE